MAHCSTCPQNMVLLFCCAFLLFYHPHSLKAWCVSFVCHPLGNNLKMVAVVSCCRGPLHGEAQRAQRQLGCALVRRHHDVRRQQSSDRSSVSKVWCIIGFTWTLDVLPF